jgi:undecaprenyl-diphosphatase
MSFLHAIIIGLLQGVTELFPISSLGHSVLLPAWLHWNDPALRQSVGESPYLAFVVGLHVATALALLAFFWRDWVRLIKAGFATLGKRRIETPDERLIWLLFVATVPAGITGIVFEHKLRTLFAKPLAAAIFLTVNAVVLFGGERLRRRDEVRALAASHAGAGAGLPDAPARQLDTLDYREAGVIGVAQVGALFAGISRSGITMVAGLVRGLDHEDAARFSFLLATPIILAAGVYKIPDLTGHLGDGIRGQTLAGAVAAAAAASVAVRFLMRYFQTRTLTPFATYCLIAGVISMIRFGLF